MSQYPPQYPQPQLPYSTPPGPYGGYPSPQGPPQSPEELLAPARRAGVTMIALGALAVMCGLCVASMAAMINNPEVAKGPQYQQLQQQFQQFEQQFHIKPETVLFVAGAIPLAAGAVLGGLGFGVRGGGRGPIIAAMVLVSLLLAGLGLIILAGLVQVVATGAGPEVFLSLCFYVVPFVLLLLTMVWLVQAAMAVSKVQWARQHYQSQLWQYQQHQQTYLQNAQQQAPPGQPQQQPAHQQPPPSGMGYYIATPPIAPTESEKKDPPDAPPPPA